VIARIRWPRTFGSLAEAEFGEYRWTFKRWGFLRPRVTVRTDSAAEYSAVLELSFGGGGLLRMRSGRCFRWTRQGFWSRQFVFADDQGAELVFIEPKLGVLRRSGTVHVHVKATPLPELPLLLLLGWYVTILIADDEASAVAICCS